MNDGNASRRLPWTAWRDKLTGQFRIFTATLPNGRKEVIMTDPRAAPGNTPHGLPWYTDPTLGAAGYFATPEAAMDAIDRKYGLVDPTPEDVLLGAARTLITAAGEVGVLMPSNMEHLLVGTPAIVVGHARALLVRAGAHVAEWRIWSSVGTNPNSLALARKILRLLAEQRGEVEALVPADDPQSSGQAVALLWIADHRAEIESHLDGLAPAAPPPSLPAPEADTGDSE